MRISHQCTVTAVRTYALLILKNILLILTCYTVSKKVEFLKTQLTTTQTQTSFQGVEEEIC